MPHIAVFTKNRTNPAYAAARLGADRTAARFGATTAHYVPDKPDDVAEQIALIERAVAERPDAAVFVPVHETAVNDAILRFDAAGIPLFNIITPTTAGRRVTFVGSNDRALAADIARYLFARMNEEGAIIIVEGTPASATSHLRLAGFNDVLAEHPAIQVRSSLRGEYQREGHLLPRELREIARHAARFVVADADGRVIGCAELAPLSATLAEVRSLVVARDVRGVGVAARLVGELRVRAEAAGFESLCAFTHDPRLFVRHNFSVVPHVWLPAKIAADCAACPLFRRCGQQAMLLQLGAAARVGAARRAVA